MGQEGDVQRFWVLLGPHYVKTPKTACPLIFIGYLTLPPDYMRSHPTINAQWLVCCSQVAQAHILLEPIKIRGQGVFGVFTYCGPRSTQNRCTSPS